MTRSTAFSGSKPRFPAIRPLTALAGTLVLSAAALAEPGRRGPEFPISVADAEHRAEARFLELDADASGEISPEELAAMPHPRFGHREFHGRHHGKRDGGPGHEPSHEQRHARRDEHAEKHSARREEMDAELFASLDANGDGQLSAAEFDTSKVREARRQAMVERMFARLDEDGSGGLSRSELPDMSRHLSAMDTDNDGTVTREEARAHRQARREARRKTGESGQS